MEKYLDFLSLYKTKDDLMEDYTFLQKHITSIIENCPVNINSHYFIPYLFNECINRIHHIYHSQQEENFFNDETFRNIILESCVNTSCITFHNIMTSQKFIHFKQVIFAILYGNSPIKLIRSKETNDETILTCKNLKNSKAKCQKAQDNEKETRRKNYEKNSPEKCSRIRKVTTVNKMTLKRLSEKLNDTTSFNLKRLTNITDDCHYLGFFSYDFDSFILNQLLSSKTPLSKYISSLNNVYNNTNLLKELEKNLIDNYLSLLDMRVEILTEIYKNYLIVTKEEELLKLETELTTLFHNIFLNYTTYKETIYSLDDARFNNFKNHILLLYNNNSIIEKLQYIRNKNHTDILDSDFNDLFTLLKTNTPYTSKLVDSVLLSSHTKFEAFLLELSYLDKKTINQVIKYRNALNPTFFHIKTLQEKVWSLLMNTPFEELCIKITTNSIDLYSLEWNEENILIYLLNNYKKLQTTISNLNSYYKQYCRNSYHLKNVFLKCINRYYASLNAVTPVFLSPFQPKKDTHELTIQKIIQKEKIQCLFSPDILDYYYFCRKNKQIEVDIECFAKLPVPFSRDYLMQFFCWRTYTNKNTSYNPDLYSFYLGSYHLQNKPEKISNLDSFCNTFYPLLVKLFFFSILQIKQNNKTPSDSIYKSCRNYLLDNFRYDKSWNQITNTYTSYLDSSGSIALKQINTFFKSLTPNYTNKDTYNFDWFYPQYKEKNPDISIDEAFNQWHISLENRVIQLKEISHNYNANIQFDNYALSRPKFIHWLFPSVLHFSELNKLKLPQHLVNPTPLHDMFPN